MADDVLDWDSAYRQEGAFEGPPPWNIGEPQPELAELIRAGKIRTLPHPRGNVGWDRNSCSKAFSHDLGVRPVRDR